MINATDPPIDGARRNNLAHYYDQSKADSFNQEPLDQYLSNKDTPDEQQPHRENPYLTSLSPVVAAEG